MSDIAYEECVYNAGIRIFKIEELEVDNKVIVDSWKTELNERQWRIEEQRKKEQEFREKREYERMKDKFGD